MSDLSKLREMVEEEAERRRQLREQISFEECSEIKLAGELFREKGIEEVANELGQSLDETRNLIKRYAVLVNSPTENVPAMAMLRGVKYYGGQVSLEELSEEADSREEVEEEIRDFVAVTLDENDIESIEVDSVEIPEDAVYPEIMTETVRKVQQSLSSISPPPALYTGLADVSARISETVTNLQPAFESLSRAISRILPEITRAIEGGVSNFDSPKDYDPDRVRFDESAEAIAVSSLERFVEQIEREEVPEPGRTSSVLNLR
ncbi:hypothetical protein [Halorussus caseinilyticus]|uniref:Uncharacterized protein n=1 Tax=Halorussus caseinilyticus TaxID=3034025 RepID=A0ABD5WGA1_9EURY